MPTHFATMVDEADMIDSFNYSSIAEWRQETASKVIDGTIKLRKGAIDEKRHYMRNLLRELKTRPLEEVAAMPNVQRKYRDFQLEEQEMLNQIEKDVIFLPEDKDHELIILDLTHHNHQPYVIKHLSYFLYPKAQAVIEVKNMFHRDVKTTDLAFSMSLSLSLNAVNHGKDVGEIMRLLNLGNGHPGAGAGTIHCNSKAEMLKVKAHLLRQIYALFVAQ